MDDFKVLLVDDETDFIETMMKRLDRRKIAVYGVNSGQAALSVLKEQAVDVVILDMLMPGMGGLETLKEVKHRHPSVEVIMLTGHGSVESGVQGMSLGAYDYVLKPVDIEVLIDKIREAAQRKRLREAND